MMKLMGGNKDTRLYEVLDAEGHKTGQILGAGEVHAQQLWHEVANVWIVNNKGEALLQLRAPDVELCPGVWDAAVGTHLRPGEVPVDAATRALQSELGITVLPENLKHLFNIRAANPVTKTMTHNVLGHVFLLKRDIDLASITLDPHKISKLVWKPVIEVMSDIGSTGMQAQYFPRQGNYYPQVFDTLLSEAPPEMSS